jgi:outer membrane protein assembly factor BamD (BamD/ComL family)
MRHVVLMMLVLACVSLLLTGCGSKSPEELFDLAQQAENDGDFQEAVDLYTMLLEKYPQNEHNYKAQFMIGFIYSEELKDYDQARMAMQKVVEQYPDCDLADDAQWMLDHMGKNLEDIEFEETAGEVETS